MSSPPKCGTYHIDMTDVNVYPRSEIPIMMAPRQQDDVFAQEILEPYCKFCYAKMFKTSAIKISEIVEIAPEMGYCI